MIVAHMVVGPGEADRYLPQVAERVFAWADWLHMALDSRADEPERYLARTYADSWGTMKKTWEDHEGEFRQEAWESMVDACNPSPEDHIVLLDADEVIHDYGMVRTGIREYPDQRLAFTFHEMWSENQYRVDGHWKPYNAWVAIPFRHGAHFKNRALACGREPTYAHQIPKVGTPIGKLLHYGYARPKDRQDKYDRYMRLDGGRFHSPDHLKSILRTPSLEEWTKGGLLSV